jgi:glutamyl-tRNA synthetase
MTEKRVRVRFAPSPTGPLHIGGVRTALYNYLFAKKHGGDFLLRIEDTDQGRFVPGAEDYIIESLKWAGIHPNEGVGFGNGPHAPYKQSERREIYKKYAEQLVEEGKAYYAFDTPEELEQLRKELEQSKAPNTSYSYHVRGRMKNSMTLSPEEVKNRIASESHYVIRFKMPENEIVQAEDIIRGHIEVNTATLDDKVLFKSDGLPTYHLANIVDDYSMHITHVIRGEEWLPSLPLHILLYRSLGWKSVMPQFAHLPLLLKPDGKGKLSKRDGDKLGFPVFPLNWTDPISGELSSGYREAGYSKEAFINMLAFLGWNPGTEQELFSLDQLAGSFSLEHVHKAGARFDFEKAKWFNHQYLVKQSNEEIAAAFKQTLTEKGIAAKMEQIAVICGLVKDRVNFVKEIWDQASFFFVAPENYDAEAIKKRWNPETIVLLTGVKEIIQTIEPFTAQHIHDVLHSHIENNKLNMGAVMVPIRIALVGTTKGPDLQVIMEIIGKDEVIHRIQQALALIKLP